MIGVVKGMRFERVHPVSKLTERLELVDFNYWGKDQICECRVIDETDKVVLDDRGKPKWRIIYPQEVIAAISCYG